MTTKYLHDHTAIHLYSFVPIKPIFVLFFYFSKCSTQMSQRIYLLNCKAPLKWDFISGLCKAPLKIIL